jgi:hypothetical protein
MGADVSRAISFVQEHGRGPEIALLKVLLRQELSDADLLALTQQQNPDGGFRIWGLKTDASGVGRTAEMLTYYASAGAADFGASHAAADFLIENQRSDGTWDESPAFAAADAPFHFRPGSNDVIGWQTAASIVALCGMGLSLDFRAALDWIINHRVGQAGGRAFFLEVPLAFAALHRTEGGEAPSTKRIRKELEAKEPKSVDGFELQWGLMAFRIAGLPVSDPIVSAWANSLAGRQQASGGFGSGPQPNGYETVLALCALEGAGALRLDRGSMQRDDAPDPAYSDHGI